MTKKEMIELMIQERLTIYFQKNQKPGMDRMKRSDEFMNLLKEKAPELVDEFQNYLDWIASHGGDEQEGIYVFGLQEGIRVMWDIICICVSEEREERSN